jgi:hypothetical protein
MKIRQFCLVGVCALIAASQASSAQSVGALRAGASKVDITPASPAGLTNLWGTPLTGIHDHIYARAIVLENGQTKEAIVAVDTVEITDGAPFVLQISKQTGIPATNIVLAATHDHSTPMISLRNADSSHQAGPAGKAFVDNVGNDMVAAVQQAQAALQPARIAVGRGAADINLNRDELTPNGYIFGRNPPGPSDKTVWVVKVESINGKPIGLLINYAVHATVIGPKNSLLTGDVSGATSRFVEDHYRDSVVALWTSGAAGDQHPAIMSDEGTLSDYEAVDTLGRILGEEVVRVADSTKAASSQVRLWSAEKTVTCPGQRVLGGGNGQPQTDIKAVDAPPVNFRLGVLMIDKIAIAEVSAEVVGKIGKELREGSPYADTILLTLANGRVGYIPDDQSYDIWTQEAVGSPLKKGCGESTIVNGLLDLIGQY